MAHTDATIKTALAAVLQTTSDELEASWDERITEELPRANNYIEAIMIGERGYTVTQLADWDMMDDTVRMQTIFFIFQFLSPETYRLSWEQIQSWDQTKFLRSMPFLDSSEAEIETEVTVSGGTLTKDVFPTDINSDDYWGD